MLNPLINNKDVSLALARMFLDTQEDTPNEPEVDDVPPKPTPVRLDPLDTLGLAKVLPADLLVILKRLAKKDAVTKRKAMDDLLVGWVESAVKCVDADERRLKESSLKTAVPVWVRGATKRRSLYAFVVL